MDDPGAVGSTTDARFIATATGDVASRGATMTGDPTASVYFETLVAADTGSGFTDPMFTPTQWEITGHPYFEVTGQPAGSVYTFAAVTLGSIPPTITDAAGYTWTLVEQVQFGNAYLTVWRAPVLADAPVGSRVQLSEVVDSGIGVGVYGFPANA